MKTTIYNYIFILFLITGMNVSAAKPGFDIHKEKTISKVYQVNSDAGIDITNKYGSIYVTTWNEDRIALDIVIKVHGKNENKVMDRLNKINVDINPLKHLVTAKTIIESMSGNNISMEINYTIKIPRRGSVTLENYYGNIVLDKIEGNSDIECRYGNVTADEMNGDSNSLSLKYCDKSSFGYIKNSVIDAGYSTVSVSKASNIKFNSSYTNLIAKDVNNLSYDSDYGDIAIGTIGNVKGAGNYLILKFGTVNGALDISTRYSSIDVNSISGRAKNLNITSSYTNVDLKYEADYAFDYECNFKYGNLQSSGLTSQIKNENGKDSFYKGYHKATGDNKINITSSYGNVRLTKI